MVRMWLAGCPGRARVGCPAGRGRQAVAESGVSWDDVEAVGIGCGGPLDSAKGILIAPLHLPGWEGVRIVERARESLGRPAVLDNDATAAAGSSWRRTGGC